MQEKWKKLVLFSHPVTVKLLKWHRGRTKEAEGTASAAQGTLSSPKAVSYSSPVVLLNIIFALAFRIKPGKGRGFFICQSREGD